MDQRTLLNRLLSPAGFGLILLLFLLPFVAVSCTPTAIDGAAGDKVDATFTGADMLVGGAPEFSGPGIDADAQQELVLLFEQQYDSEPLAIVAAVLIFIGMATALLRSGRIRHLTAAVIALLAAVFLVGAIMRAIDRLQHINARDVVGADADLPPGVAEPKYGFWLALAGLIVLAAGHAVALVRARRQPAEAAPTVVRPVPGPVEEGETGLDGLF
jgi:hypothetical protein